VKKDLRKSCYSSIVKEKELKKHFGIEN